MEPKKYLNEERYQKTKSKLSKLALVILLIGLLVGGSLIATGLIKQSKINSKYSQENKVKVQEQLETEKQNLLSAKANLENKIKPVEDEIKKLDREPFTGFNDEYYARKDKIEELKASISADKSSIMVIDEALDNSFNHCSFGETKNNAYTSKYCSLKNELNNITEFKKSFESNDCIPFYIFGAFAIIVGSMISFSIYMTTKQREIVAFGAQQIMPVAKEGIEEMTPVIGNAIKENMENVAPALGKAAKEISKGIKEGIDEAKK